MNIVKMFLLFIIYAFLGWVVEMFYNYYEHKKFVNRGFLIGPYCPIYGVGGLIVTIFLTKYKDSLFVTFGMSMILFALLEYFTSYLMEKLFKARWWDYSDKKFNINGRICLETLIPFGILGCVAIYIVNPLIFSLLSLTNMFVLRILAIVILIIFIIDFSISLKIINSFKDTAVKFLKKDNTEEITKKVKEILISKSILTKRLIESFPKVKAVIGNINIEFIKTKFELKNTKKELKKTKKELKKERKKNKSKNN